MKSSNSGWVRSIFTIIGLSLCLVFVCLATAGAAAPTVTNDAASAAAATGGSPPVILVFKADPMTLETPTSAAVYTFTVKRAKNVVITEAGNDIKNISNPSGATINGIATGLPASAIPADDSGKFKAVLMASNEYGTDTKALTLSLAKELLSTGAGAGPTGSENETGGNKSKWLDQLPISPPPKSIQSYINKNEPNFFKCPSGCENCLKPGDAASLGFTQKCSEERCYYSPDGQQKWYCYKPTPGWCCANGKVNPSTKAECDKLGGFWSTVQAEATERCQPGCCCLSNGQISYPSTQSQCAQMYGTYYSNLGLCKELCQPTGCCCVNGQINYPSTKSQCAQMYGTFYTDLSQCKERCQPAGCCCVNGQISYPSTQSQCAQMYGTYYTDLGQCRERCQAMCWCCLKGQVYQTTQAQCTGSGGACYSTESQATAGCRQTTPTTPKTPYLR